MPNITEDNSSIAQRLPATQNESIYQRFIRTLKINNVAAIVAIVLLVLFDGQADPKAILLGIIISLVHSHSIGTLIALSFPLLSRQFNRLSFPNNWVMLITSLVVLSILGCLLAGLLLVLFNAYGMAQYWKYFFVCVRGAILIGLGFGSAIFIYHTFQMRLEKTELQLRLKELDEERALKLATQARLSMLEAQIHPHFLFNTLNSISALIQDDPDLAERLVERLAALLRFSLDSNHHSLVPLKQELKIVIDYLEIEKARFDMRLQYQINIAEDLLSIKVPPLSIQTIIENSVKYAISPHRSGGKIVLSAKLIDDSLCIEIIDDGPGFSAENLITGHGLDNLRTRLLSLFGAKALLSISKLDNGSLVKILLPINQEQLLRSNSC